MPWVQTNILDGIQATLDATVFNAPQSTEPSVKPGIIKFVKKVIYSAMTEAGWPDPRDYLNLILTGSLTTYQYSEHSDFDISLWVDAERLPTWVRADLIALMIEKCDGTVVPGTTHPMQCFVVDIARTTREQIYQPGLRSAYDLDAKVWIVPPEHREIDVNAVYKGAVAYAKTVVDKVKLMLAYDKPALKQYWHFLHKNRMRDMRAGKGDFSESNIVYKALSNEGLLPLISEATGEHIAKVKTAMSADPTWLQNWIHENGPYLYHGVTGRGADAQPMVDSILEKGIQPNMREPASVPDPNDYDWSGSDSSDEWDWPSDYDNDVDEWWHNPRRNHVYMVVDPENAYGTHLFRVDLRQLDPNNLNPDDDLARDEGLVHYKDPTKPDLGEQVEALGWGNDPNDTHRSFDYGVIAHRGAIPPTAIEYYGTRPESQFTWKPVLPNEPELDT